MTSLDSDWWVALHGGTKPLEVINRCDKSDPLSL